MFFMVIEHFKNGDAAAVYRRFKERGRMMPDGLKYLESWTDAKFERCFQLMECDDRKLFDEWINNWKDLVDFEVIPVMQSREAAEAMAQKV